MGFFDSIRDYFTGGDVQREFERKMHEHDKRFDRIERKMRRKDATEKFKSESERNLSGIDSKALAPRVTEEMARGIKETESAGPDSIPERVKKAAEEERLEREKQVESVRAEIASIKGDGHDLGDPSSWREGYGHAINDELTPTTANLEMLQVEIDATQADIDSGTADEAVMAHLSSLKERRLRMLRQMEDRGSGKNAA